MRAQTCHLLLGAAALAALSGCLERKETIRVQRDGAVRMEMEIKGGPADFDGPATLPTREAGWRVSDETHEGQQGTEQVRTVRADYRRGEPLPDAFATPDTEEYETGLRFPTEVTVERRRDGTYYHFRRTYPARPFARYEYYREYAREHVFDIEAALENRSLQDLPRAEQEQVLRALQFVEYGKHLEDLKEAMSELEEPWPVDRVLRLETALQQHFAHPPIDAVLDVLNAPEEQRDEAAVDEIASQFLREIDPLYVEALTAGGASDRTIDLFFRQLDLATARRAVTEDLGDEEWTIELELPGEILWHNADRQEDGHRLAWQFRGAAMFDRDHVLLATSRVARRGATDPEAQPE